MDSIVLPATLISQHSFSLHNIKPCFMNKMKEAVLNRTNSKTLESFVDDGQFPTSEIIASLINVSVIEWISKNPKAVSKGRPSTGSRVKKERKSKGCWVDDLSLLGSFKDFIEDNYIICAEPKTKFKAIMQAFTTFSGVKISPRWNSKYTNVFIDLNITVVNVKNPKYEGHPRNTGVRFICLKEKGIAKKYRGIVLSQAILKPVPRSKSVFKQTKSAKLSELSVGNNPYRFSSPSLVTKPTAKQSKVLVSPAQIPKPIYNQSTPKQSKVSVPSLPPPVPRKVEKLPSAYKFTDRNGKTSIHPPVNRKLTYESDSDSGLDSDSVESDLDSDKFTFGEAQFTFGEI